MRITPSIRSQRGLRIIIFCSKLFAFFLFSGWIWSKNTLSADNWILDVKVRVTGRGRVGADGMVRILL